MMRLEEGEETRQQDQGNAAALGQLADRNEVQAAKEKEAGQTWNLAALMVRPGAGG